MISEEIMVAGGERLPHDTIIIEKYLPSTEVCPPHWSLLVVDGSGVIQSVCIAEIGQQDTTKISLFVFFRSLPSPKNRGNQSGPSPPAHNTKKLTKLLDKFNDIPVGKSPREDPSEWTTHVAKFNDIPGHTKQSSSVKITAKVTFIEWAKAQKRSIRVWTAQLDKFYDIPGHTKQEDL
ncbi:hypothetical protein BDB01DRAFT_851972 [Pilobolus umbonatus]|nr:hypothetical protein BDB01DRAFT_851972 [Pilobolus umbonatus]